MDPGTSYGGAKRRYYILKNPVKLENIWPAGSSAPRSVNVDKDRNFKLREAVFIAKPSSQGTFLLSIPLMSTALGFQ